MAYDSMQLKSAEKNYSIHKKELLAIVWALKKSGDSTCLSSKCSNKTVNQSLQYHVDHSQKG